MNSSPWPYSWSLRKAAANYLHLYSGLCSIPSLYLANGMGEPTFCRRRHCRKQTWPALTHQYQRIGVTEKAPKRHAFILTALSTPTSSIIVVAQTYRRNNFLQNASTTSHSHHLVAMLHEIRSCVRRPAGGASKKKRQTRSKTMRAPLVVRYET